jgi:hypothetical protein
MAHDITKDVIGCKEFEAQKINISTEPLEFFGETTFHESITIQAGVPTLIFDDTHAMHDKYRIRLENDILCFGAGSPVVDIMQLDSADNSVSITNMTAGSIPFFSTGGKFTEDNDNLFWDDSNNRLGIGTKTPNVCLEISQQADDEGIKINGFDNVSGQNIKIHVLPSGQTSIISSNLLGFNSEAGMDMYAGGATGGTQPIRFKAVEFAYGRFQTNNPTHKWYGLTTTPVTQKYIQWQIELADKKLHLTREDTDIAGFQIEMPTEIDDILILPKASGKGIKVDIDTPTFGFADLLGDQFSRNTGATKPTLATYNGVIKAWQFGDGDEAYLSFHIPHDYVKGTDLFLHIHWSQTYDSATGGDLDFKYTGVYAKGHNQTTGSTFTATPKTGLFSSIDINDGESGLDQYQHHLTEVVISAATATGALFDRDDFEPDGVIELTFEMVTNNITGVAVTDPFIHYVDIHYQTTGLIGTKDKAPDFYA